MCVLHSGAYPVTQTVKNLPTMQETHVQSLGQKDPLKKGMATHSSILVWRIPWTEEPDGLQSRGSQRAGHDRVTNTFTFTQTVCFKSDQSHFRCSAANMTGDYCIKQFSSTRLLNSRKTRSEPGKKIACVHGSGGGGGRSVVSWTVALQVLLSMEFSRREYWSGQPFPSPGDLSDPGI